MSILVGKKIEQKNFPILLRPGGVFPKEILSISQDQNAPEISKLVIEKMRMKKNRKKHSNNAENYPIFTTDNRGNIEMTYLESIKKRTSRLEREGLNYVLYY